MLGGIYSGYFAVSEAAAVTALYVVIVEIFILREIKLSALPGIMRSSMVLVGGQRAQTERIPRKPGHSGFQLPRPHGNKLSRYGRLYQ